MNNENIHEGHFRVPASELPEERAARRAAARSRKLAEYLDHGTEAPGKEAEPMIYFTSDTHLMHENVLGFMEERARRWETIDEMNEALIANINATVGPDDELYCLGDFSFKGTRERAAELRRRIRCRKVHLIHGNHDKDWRQPEVAGTFIVEPEVKALKVNGRKLVLSHYPMADWPSMTHGSIHLHGHIHSVGSAYNQLNRSQGVLRYDVGVDANGFAPVSLDNILAWFCGVECRGRIGWEDWASLPSRAERGE